MRLTLVVSVALLAIACGSSPSAPAPSQQPQQQTPPPTGGPPPGPTTPYWDVAAQGVPRLTTHNYIDLARIREISRFRSGVGHDYWDDFERCRSMKHYFMTPQDSSAADVGIYAPFDGDVTRMHQEWATADGGMQIEITSTANPAFAAIVFHVNPSAGIAVGTRVSGGQRLGTHIGPQTMSDITIAVSEKAGRRLVSWFETMSDGVFAIYQARGMTSRGQAVITQAERDASPLSCSGEAFASPGALPNWVSLN
jgi:hypothetical protein